MHNSQFCHLLATWHLDRCQVSIVYRLLKHTLLHLKILRIMRKIKFKCPKKLLVLTFSGHPEAARTLAQGGHIAKYHLLYGKTPQNVTNFYQNYFKWPIRNFCNLLATCHLDKCQVARFFQLLKHMLYHLKIFRMGKSNLNALNYFFLTFSSHPVAARSLVQCGHIAKYHLLYGASYLKKTI